MVKQPTFEEKIKEIVKGWVAESIFAEKVENIILGTEDGRWNLFSIAPKKPYKKRLLADAWKVYWIFVAITKRLYLEMQNYEVSPALPNRSVKLYDFENYKSLLYIWLELKNAGSVEIVIQPCHLYRKALRRPLRDPEDLIHIFPHSVLKKIIKENYPNILKRIGDDVLISMEGYLTKLNLSPD